MKKTLAQSTFLLVLLMITVPALARPAGQNPSAGSTESQEIQIRQAIDRKDYLRAITILNSIIADRPAPEPYLTLGGIYRRTKDFQKAEDTLTEASNRFPMDPRIPFELANAYLDAGDVDGARNQLHRVIQIDPQNVQAADLLAAIELSEGEVQTALHYWNATGFPIVNSVLHNTNVAFGHWTVREANAFKVGKLMTYSEWRTTQQRLFETHLYSNVGISVEPAATPGKYNPVILTTDKTNDLPSIGFGLIKGAPYETTYLDYWDIAESGLSVRSSYRWNYNRRRAEAHLDAPLPVPGVLFFHAAGIWRKERWDLRQLQTDAGPNDRFEYDSTGVLGEFKYIPNFRFDAGAGFEYTNRQASGGVPNLLINSENSAKFIYEASLRLSDRKLYQNRLHAEGYVARKGILGDLNYQAGTVELNNRFVISEDNAIILDWTVKGGSSWGQLPVEDYFVLGVDQHSQNLLRGHKATSHGHYGNAPMGTSFGLSNFTAERRIAILPLFNSLNLPYVEMKAEFFLDIGRTWDREDNFKQGTLFVDTGGGLKLGTPTHALNMIYGHSLREGGNLFILNLEKKW